MVSILLLLTLFSVHHAGHNRAFSLTNCPCNNGSSYGINSSNYSNVVALLGSLSANASNSTVGFATGTLGRASDEVWGLALWRGGVNGASCTSCLALASSDVAFSNCRGVKAPQACQGCLGKFRDEMPAVFNDTAGAQFNAVWSNLRCELYLVYDSSPVVTLVMPQPSTPPLPAPTSPVGQNANRTRGPANASTVINIVLGVLVTLMSTFTIYLWKKGQANQYAEEDDNSRSLLFDFPTLRWATANFAEENKLEHGGFGAVYKGFLPDGRQTAVKMAGPVDMRCVCTASVLLLLSLSISLLPSAGATRAELDMWKCDNGTYYAENTTYESNVRSLLASLAANASRSLYPVGFATASLGASPDKVWALGLCRGNTNGTDCGSCLALAPEVAFGQHCMGVKDVSIFYDRCILRYSFQDFLTSPDNRQVQARGINSNNVTGDASWFNTLVVSLIGALSDWAAFNTTSRYAVGVMSSDQGFPVTDKGVVHMINGLVQCTPDQAPGPCRECLQALIDEMPAIFNGSVGGRFFTVWCHLRFEVHEFYYGGPMLKLVAPPSPPPPPMSTDQTGGNGTRWRQRAATVSAIVLGVLVVLLLSIVTVFLWRNARTQLSYQEDEDPASLLFDLATLKHATDNFAQHNMLGHGGFGAVYKGFLPDGRQIAVKRMDKASGQGFKELRNELLVVAKLRHNNLAKLLGVCLKGQEKLLVYEYLPNRSLDTFLFAPEIEKRLLLDWETRYRIIYGTARGLVYLHEDSQIKIIHRDLKAGNILLDADMNPKISDFGLARLFNGDNTTSITSQVVGTLGYMAPEYAVLGHLSVKLDVYSFGVLVLEIVTGRKNTDMFESAVRESTTLLNYVWDEWLKGTALETMDPSLDSQIPEIEVLKCIHLGLLCVQENPADRPTMLDVLVMLHGHTSSFAAPSKPAFSFARGDLSSANSDSVSGDPGTQRASAALLSVNGMSESEFQPR